MKKKELINLFTKSIVGFPIGIMFLMISYGSVYLVGGQEIFANEINQLKNIDVFLNQIIVSGIVYYIIFALMKSIMLYESDSIKNGIIKFIIELAVMIICFLLIKFAEFSSNLVYMYIVVFVLASVLFSIGNIIILFRNRYLINKKIKERNNK